MDATHQMTFTDAHGGLGMVAVWRCDDDPDSTSDHMRWRFLFAHAPAVPPTATPWPVVFGEETYGTEWPADPDDVLHGVIGMCLMEADPDGPGWGHLTDYQRDWSQYCRLDLAAWQRAQEATS